MNRLTRRLLQAFLNNLRNNDVRHFSTLCNGFSVHIKDLVELKKEVDENMEDAAKDVEKALKKIKN